MPKRKKDPKVNAGSLFGQARSSTTQKPILKKDNRLKKLMSRLEDGKRSLEEVTTRLAREDKEYFDTLNMDSKRHFERKRQMESQGFIGGDHLKLKEMAEKLKNTTETVSDYREGLEKENSNAPNFKQEFIDPFVNVCKEITSGAEKLHEFVSSKEGSEIFYTIAKLCSSLIEAISKVFSEIKTDFGVNTDTRKKTIKLRS